MKHEDDAPQQIAVAIRRSWPQLTPTQQRVGEFVMSNPSEAAFLGCRGLATRCATSPATITRLVRALGFSTYRHFQSVLQEDFGRTRTPHERLQRTLTTLEEAEESAITPAETTLRTDTRLLGETTSTLQLHAVERAAKLIQGARIVHIFGVGLAKAALETLDYRLTRLSIPTNTIAAEDRATLQRIMTATREDVLVAFAFHPVPKGLQTLIEVATHKHLELVLIGAPGPFQPPEYGLVIEAPQGPLTELTSITPAVAVSSAIALTVAARQPAAAGDAYKIFETYVEGQY